MVYLPHRWYSACQHFKAFTNFFHVHSQIHADKVFVRYYSNDTTENGCYKSLTYANVEHIATYLACQIYDLLQYDTITHRIGYLGDYGLDYILVMLACLKLRMTLFNISPRNSEAAITHLLKETNCRVLLTNLNREQLAKNACKGEAEDVRVVPIQPLQLDQMIQQALHPKYQKLFNYTFTDGDVEKVALIIHSSGSTDFPKPIQLSNRYLFTLISMLYIQADSDPSIEPWTENDVILALGPLFHCFGVMCAFSLVAVGGSSVILPKLPPSHKEIEYALRTNRVTFFGCLPYVMEEMLLYLPSVSDLSFLQNLRYMTFGGSPLRRETGEWFHQRGIKVRNTYGSTETGIMFTADFSPESDNWYSVHMCLKDAQGQPSYTMFEEVSPGIYHLSISGDCPSLATQVANRSDGGFDTNDLFRKDPEHPGYYIYEGRRDDTLIMENGEKTNPIPMEAAIRSHPIVKQVAICGHARHCTACLIHVDVDYALQFTPEAIIQQVYDAVQLANGNCPTHSKVVVPDMVYILPLNQQLPSTDKGTLRRKAALTQYEAVIHEMYDRFLNRKNSNQLASIADTRIIRESSENEKKWSKEALSKFLTECVSSLLNIPATFIAQNTSRSLFEYGLNSLTAIQLRNMIAVQFKEVSMNFLFHNTSIGAICEALSLPDNELNGEGRTWPAAEEREYQQAQRWAEAYIKKATDDFAPAQYSSNNSANRNAVVLLTGATGTVGAFILRDLLMRNDVIKVYCCVRSKGQAEEQLFTRLIEAFELSSLDTSLLITSCGRVEALPMRFKDPYLGWSEEKYKQLRKEVTIVQHCAWLLDFHMPVDHYDRECIAPFYNLLKFALQKDNPMQVHFISSVSASANSPKQFSNNTEFKDAEVEEVPLPIDSRVAMPLGYAQSKFICEGLLNFLAVEKKYLCYVIRLGQICGDTSNGVWNIAEQYPRMFVGGAVFQHKLPAAIPNLHTIDWIPVDFASSAIVEIMLKNHENSTATTHQFVYHIVNPNRTTWDRVLEAAKGAGLKFNSVSFADWINCIRQEKRIMGDRVNPAYPLLPYYERMLLSEKVASRLMPTWSTTETVKIASRLKDAPTLDARLFKKFIDFWRKESGFLEQ